MNQIPYKDKYISLENYKEPLREVVGGFGYYGTISVTTDGTGVVCHECGEIFSNLGHHIIHKHKMGVKEYKEKYQLSSKASLLSEAERFKRKERALKQYMAMTTEERENLYRSQKRGKKHKNRKRSLSERNERGSCPDQILAKIEECYIDLGHVPTKVEFIDWCGSERYAALAYRTFGGWVNALKRLGLEHKQRQNGGMRHRWTQDDLLDLIDVYYQENGVWPTEGDCRRGLLPSQSVFHRHFGGLKNAREIAQRRRINSPLYT